jgi:hypothetical protein
VGRGRRRTLARRLCQRCHHAAQWRNVVADTARRQQAAWQWRRHADGPHRRGQQCIARQFARAPLRAAADQRLRVAFARIIASIKKNPPLKNALVFLLPNSDALVKLAFRKRKMSAYRIVCIGEALIDMFSDSSDGIMWRAAVGGSPLNVAIAAARLVSAKIDAENRSIANNAKSVSFIGTLSHDRLGKLIRKACQDSNVDIRKCISGECCRVFRAACSNIDFENCCVSHHLMARNVSKKLKSITIGCYYYYFDIFFDRFCAV